MFEGLKNKVKGVFGKKTDKEVKNENSAVVEVPLNEAGEEEIPVATPAEEVAASEKVKEAVGEAINNAKDGVEKVADSKAVNTAGNAVEIAASTVGETIENVGEKVVEGGKKIADSKAVNTAGDAVEKVVFAVGDAAEKVGGKIWSGIKKTGASVGNFAQKQFGEIKKNFTDKAETAGEEVKPAQPVENNGAGEDK